MTLPLGASVPPPGSWVATRLSGLTPNRSNVLYLKPACLSSAMACSSGMSTTSGTLTRGGPSETTTETVLPGATKVPLAGL